jgi:hypothetical protein
VDGVGGVVGDCVVGGLDWIVSEAVGWIEAR